MKKKSVIEMVIEEFTLKAVAEACKVTPASVILWRKKRRLPRSEWTNETTYAEKIEKLTNGKYTKVMLLKI